MININIKTSSLNSIVDKPEEKSNKLEIKFNMSRDFEHEEDHGFTEKESKTDLETRDKDTDLLSKRDNMRFQEDDESDNDDDLFTSSEDDTKTMEKKDNKKKLKKSEIKDETSKNNTVKKEEPGIEVAQEQNNSRQNYHDNIRNIMSSQNPNEQDDNQEKNNEEENLDNDVV